MTLRRPYENGPPDLKIDTPTKACLSVISHPGKDAHIVGLCNTVKVDFQWGLYLHWAMWNEFQCFLDDKSRQSIGVEDEIASRRPLISKYGHDTLISQLVLCGPIEIAHQQLISLL
jgi:hypothetical protein